VCAGERGRGGWEGGREGGLRSQQFVGVGCCVCCGLIDANDGRWQTKASSIRLLFFLPLLSPSLSLSPAPSLFPTSPPHACVFVLLSTRRREMITDKLKVKAQVPVTLQRAWSSLKQEQRRDLHAWVP
jgi:hypothetical protein